MSSGSEETSIAITYSPRMDTWGTVPSGVRKFSQTKCEISVFVVQIFVADTFISSVNSIATFARLCNVSSISRCLSRCTARCSGSLSAVKSSPSILLFSYSYACVEDVARFSNRNLILYTFGEDLNPLLNLRADSHYTTVLKPSPVWSISLCLPFSNCISASIYIHSILLLLTWDSFCVCR